MTTAIPTTKHAASHSRLQTTFIVLTARSPVIARLPLLILGLASALAQESFTPPQAYPADRYETGWNKNPFTLKTAPVAVQQESFAKDLVLAGHYGSSTNPTIVVANKTTRERTPLKLGQPASNGMELKSASIKPSRKDTSAEVTMGGQTATLHYDNSFISQMAAQSAAPPPVPGQPQVAIPGQPGAVAMNAPQMRPGTAGLPMPQAAASPYAAPRTPTPQPATPNFSGMPQPGSAASALNATGNVPTPVRRRLLTAPVAQPPANPAPVR